MPYAKKTYKKSYKKNYKNKPVTTMQLYKAIHKNIENKFYWEALTSQFNSIGSASWIERDLVGVTQSVAERIGREINVRSIEINGILASGANETAVDDPYNVVRVVLLLGDQATVLQTASKTINDVIRVANTYGMRKKYLDKVIPLTITSTEKGAGDGYTAGLRKFKYYKKFKKPMKIMFASATWNSNDIHIVLSMKSDSGAIVNPGFIQGYWCMTYEDA